MVSSSSLSQVTLTFWPWCVIAVSDSDTEPSPVCEPDHEPATNATVCVYKANRAPGIARIRLQSLRRRSRRAVPLVDGNGATRAALYGEHVDSAEELREFVSPVVQDFGG